MVSGRNWVIINISLGLLAILLVLNLAGVQLPSLGQALYTIDDSDLICYSSWQGELSKVEDVDRCCLLASQQISCQPSKLKIDNHDLTRQCGSPGSVQLHFNKKSYRYCQQLEVWQ